MYADRITSYNVCYTKLLRFDLLHQARVDSDGNVQTFKQIYAIHVEEPFADKFLNGLLLLDDVSFGHQTLRARFARGIANP